MSRGKVQLGVQYGNGRNERNVNSRENEFTEKKGNWKRP